MAILFAFWTNQIFVINFNLKYSEPLRMKLGVAPTTPIIPFSCAVKKFFVSQESWHAIFH